MATITSLTSASQDMLQGKVWFQQTIWNKFGCPSVRHTSLQDLMHSTAILFASAKVAKYIVMVNQLIDEAVSDKRDGESAKAHTEEGFPTGTNQAGCCRLQLSNQTWFQLAVWNTFGSKSADLSSLKELELATAGLFASAEVAKFIISVNSMIDREKGNVEEAEQQADGSLSSADARHTEPASPTHTVCSDTSSALSSHTDMDMGGDKSDTRTGLVGVHTRWPQNKRKQRHGSLFGTDSSEASQDSQEEELIDATNLGNEGEGEEDRKEGGDVENEEDEEEDEVVVLSSTVTPYIPSDSDAGDGKCVKKESVLMRWFGEEETPCAQEKTSNAFKVWTEDEEALLAQLVSAHTNQGRTNWKTIGRILRRTPSACQNKHSQPHRREKIGEGGTRAGKRQRK